MRSPSRFATTTLTELVPRSIPRTAAPRWSDRVDAVSVMVVSPPRGLRRAGLSWWRKPGTRLGGDHDLVGGGIVRQSVERLAVVVQTEAVGDHPVGSDPAVAHGVDRRPERRDLRERTPDRDLPAEHVERVEPDEVLVARHAVDQDGSAVAGQRYADVADSGGAGRLDDDVEPVTARRLLAQPADVGLGVAAIDLHGPVDAQRPGRFQFEGARRGDGDRRRAAGGDELRQQEAGGTGTEDEGARARADLQRLDPVHGAGGGLREDGRVLRQPFDREREPLRNGDVLSEEPGEVAPVRLEVLAEDEPARQAVLAEAAVDVRVHRDLLAEPEACRPLPELVHDADELVARDQREDGVEVALVDVQIGAAHPDLVHLDAHLPRLRLGNGDIGDAEAARSVVQDGLHSDLPVPGGRLVAAASLVKALSLADTA